MGWRGWKKIKKLYTTRDGALTLAKYATAGLNAPIYWAGNELAKLAQKGQSDDPPEDPALTEAVNTTPAQIQAQAEATDLTPEDQINQFARWRKSARLLGRAGTFSSRTADSMASVGKMGADMRLQRKG